MKKLFHPCLLVLALFSTQFANAQVPVLSSYPSATATIFLDFDGHTVNGTAWNYNGPIVCGPSGLTTDQMTEIFDRVSEDYRPFNINITTDSTKYLSAPANRRMRVILTVTSSWYGSAGGVAYVGSFTWGDDTPCFIFSALLGYNTKNIAEAAAHEAGHTLGLYHQAAYDSNCVKTSDYNYGVGGGEIGWAPIMGVGYYRNMTLWNNGPNPYGCSQSQSDLDIITSNNGFTYRTDDYSGTLSSASTASFVNNQFSLNGIIERNTDQDAFKFTMPADGQFSLNAIPYNVGSGNAGSDLDMQVTLYNSSQTVINVYNPDAELNSVVDTMLTAGTYYIKVEGKGNIYAPNYASLGSYSLQATMAAGNPLPLRRLELKGNLDGNKHELSWLIDADEQVVSQAIEISTDGRNFNTLTEVSNEARSYSYLPSKQVSALYRLNVTFDNGKKYYSNIATIRQFGNSPKPQLVGNLIHSVITITSPGKFNYQIADYNGRIVNQGQISEGMNTIASSGLTSGLYLIRYTDGNNQWTEKLVKQ